MTIINGIEIDYISYDKNIIKEAIENNEPIENKLHVIAVISNPCLFARRYILMKEFINRFEKEESNVILYIVELAYKNQKFIITDKNNKKHLQLRTECPLWHKENMINVGVQKLLPKNYKAFAWIDADVEFENNSWALDTLKVLNGTRDIVQLFSHCLDMNKENGTMRIFNSGGYQYCKQRPFFSSGQELWHPGYAWAITRKAYEKIGGLYEHAILGSGDHIMLQSLINNGANSLHESNTTEYKNTVIDFQDNIKRLRFGYTPGIIRHYYHGSKKNRQYQDRWQMLVKHEYNPYSYITKDENGLLIPTKLFPEELKTEIMQYFLSRNEDEDYK
jgi:hypothetical protein